MVEPKHQRVSKEGEHLEGDTRTPTEVDIQNRNTGSAAECFLRRKPKHHGKRGWLEKHDWGKNNWANKASHQARQKPKKFKAGDKVILHETTGRRKQWIDTGVIREPRISDNDTCHSFIVDLDRGGQCLRNKRHIKHYRATTTPHRKDEALSVPPNMNIRARRRSEWTESFFFCTTKTGAPECSRKKQRNNLWYHWIVSIEKLVFSS